MFWLPRWNDVSSGQGKERHYILNYFLEDETIEMREIVDVRGGDKQTRLVDCVEQFSLSTS